MWDAPHTNPSHSATCGRAHHTRASEPASKALNLLLLSSSSFICHLVEFTEADRSTPVLPLDPPYRLPKLGLLQVFRRPQALQLLHPRELALPQGVDELLGRNRGGFPERGGLTM